jgi:glycosidase
LGHDTLQILIKSYDSIRQILALRRRQSKNALTMLLLSQGVPMLLMGNEFGRTQLGNNDAYRHFANTAMAPPADIWEPGQEPPLAEPREVLLEGWAIIVLLAR